MLQDPCFFPFLKGFFGTPPFIFLWKPPVLVHHFFLGEPSPVRQVSRSGKLVFPRASVLVILFRFLRRCRLSLGFLAHTTHAYINIIVVVMCV